MGSRRIFSSNVFFWLCTLFNAPGSDSAVQWHNGLFDELPYSACWIDKR